MDPTVMNSVATFDPGNQYAVDYMWGTTALGYNVDKVKAALPNAPLDSWDLLVKPENAKALAGCGVTVLDAPQPENALKFIYYIMEPKATADISNNEFYANGNKAAFPLTDKAITSDPNIYPPVDVQAKLVPLQSHSQEFTRLLTRAWTRIK